MPFIHHRWEKSGRKLVHDMEPNRFLFKSFAGQQNIDIGNGEFVPYIWDAQNKIAKYGNFQVQFFDWYQVIKRLIPEEKVVIDDQRFEVQYFQGNKWRVLDLYNHTISTTEDTENGLFFIKKIYTGDGQDILEVEYQIGQRNWVRFSIYLKVENAGTYRIRWQNTGVQGEIQENATNIKFDDICFSWMPNETPLRSYEIEQQAQGKKVDIFMGSYELNDGEEILISPDTWGYTDADSDADLNITDDTWDPNTGSNTIWAGKPADNDEWNLGLRFVNVTVPKDATINTAYIRLARDLHNNPCYWKIRGIDEDDTAAFMELDNWTDRNQTTAAIDWDTVDVWDWGVLTASPDIKTIIAEITTRAGWVSGQAMGIWVDDDGCGGWDGIKALDETVTNSEPDMEIDYTEAAVADILKQTTYYYNMLRAGNIM